MNCKSRVSIGLRGDAYKSSSRRRRQASLIFRVVMFTEVGWSAVNKRSFVGDEIKVGNAAGAVGHV